MINSIKILDEKYQKRLGGKTEFTFKPGVNVISGANGSGKSTLLCLLSGNTVKWKLEYKDCMVINQTEGTKIFLFTSETDAQKPRVAFDDNIPMELQVQTMFTSRGQTHSMLLANFIRNIKPKIDENSTVLLDEPEVSFDNKGVSTLIWLVTKFNCQVILTAHHPFFLLSQQFNHIELTENYRATCFAETLLLLNRVDSSSESHLIKEEKCQNTVEQQEEKPSPKKRKTSGKQKAV